MTRKVIIVWLTGLFAWNALFGAFGGLLLCIHEGALHLESAVEIEDGCADGCDSFVAVDYQIAASESCLDIELSKVLVIAQRTDEGPFNLVASPVLMSVLDTIEPIFTLKEFAASHPTRAPPDILDTSVLVAQTHSLRI